MPIEERWVQNGSVRLHCLAQETDSTLTSFLIVPGTFGVAEDYVQEMEALAPRRCITVSLRGRGRSEDRSSDSKGAGAERGAERDD